MWRVASDCRISPTLILHRYDSGDTLVAGTGSPSGKSYNQSNALHLQMLA